MKYIKPNWLAINKAIAEGDIKELRAEEFKIKEKIQAKVEAYYKEKRKREALDKISVLKLLPVGGTVYYTGSSGDDIKFGNQGRKVKDGRSRMVVDFYGKKWRVYYTYLKTLEVTTEEKSSRACTERIMGILN